MKVILIQVVKTKRKFIPHGILQAGSNTSQIVGSLVKVSVVQVVFLLKNRYRHNNHHVHSQSIVRSYHSLKNIAANNIDG